MAQPSSPKPRPRDLLEIVEDVAVYPPEAYEFIQLGLQHTVSSVHTTTPPSSPPDASHHVTGQQLSLGIRDYAWHRWGLLARAVLSRWNITSTMDFGKIVYALIEAQVLARNDSDRLEDFRNVFDFRSLDTDYTIPSTPPSPHSSPSPSPQPELDALPSDDLPSVADLNAALPTDPSPQFDISDLGTDAFNHVTPDADTDADDELDELDELDEDSDDDLDDTDFDPDNDDAPPPNTH